MTTGQFNRALALAKTPDAVSWLRYDGDLPVIDLEIFDGCALAGAAEVVCTIEDVAKFIKYQALCFNGSWDEREIADLRDLARRRFRIYGDPIQEARDEAAIQRRALARQEERLRHMAQTLDEQAARIEAMKPKPAPPRVPGRIRAISLEE